MSLTNLEFSSQFRIDKIVNVAEGSFNAATDTTTKGTLRDFSIAHTFVRPLFTDLLWSTDQVNWIDGGSGQPSNNFDACISYSDIVSNHILTTKTSGTVYYKLISYWINDYDTTNPSVPSFSADNADLFFDSRVNYQKIAFEGIEEFTGSSVKVVTHNLGYRPNFKAYIEAFPGEVWNGNFGGSKNKFLYDYSNQVEMAGFSKIDTLELEAFYGSATPTARVWYKIYYDAGIT